MPEEWRLLRTGALPGAMNMALDEALFEAVAAGRSRPLLRLYRWSPPTLSIGYGQSLAEVNLEACRRLGVDVIRRPTGGRAVLHDRECTYAVAARSGGPIPATIPASYRVLGEILQKALARLGLATEMAGRRPAGTQPGICFTAPGQSELVFRQLKFTGSSQKRRGDFFLQHGSIPVEMDLKKLWQVLDVSGADPESGAVHLAARVGWLNRFLDPPVSVEQVEDALIAVFSRELKVRFRPEEPTVDEWESARRLARKYAGWQWTRHDGKTLPTENRPEF